MLYGNLIFIKKTGGDGSKFPVTERNIKIGRSENCLIRIYNPEVALEHCQIIVEDNGQVTLRNFSNKTVLNGELLSQRDVILGHGDIFKLGERLVRWEYLPTSKYFRQLLSPTGRLVAVVIPQQRTFEDQAVPGTSASQISLLKNTPLGKRKNSERDSSETITGAKIRKSSNSDFIGKNRGDLPKFTGHHSLKTTKLLQEAKVKERKSISGMISSQTPRKSRKSTLASWKVNILSPPEEKFTRSSSATKLQKKSVKSPERADKIPLEDFTESKFSEKSLQSAAKNQSKTSPRNKESKPCEDKVKSTAKSILKTPLQVKVNSSAEISERSTRSTYSKNKSPSPKKLVLKSPSKILLSTPKKKSPKLARIIHSESKLNSSLGKHLLFPKGTKRMSLILGKADSATRQSLGKKFRKSNAEGCAKTSEVKSEEIFSDNIMNTPFKPNLIKQEFRDDQNQVSRKSLKNTPKKGSPEKLEASRKKGSLKKPFKNSPVVVMKTAKKNSLEGLTQEQSKNTIMNMQKVDLDTVAQTPLIDFNNTPNTERGRHTPRKTLSAKRDLMKKTPVELIKNTRKNKSPLSFGRKTSVGQNKSNSDAAVSPVDKSSNSSVNSDRTSTSSRSRKSSIKQVNPRKSENTSKGRVNSRGFQRKLSPSSSAERAAKKLKTSSPKKPDKNKKAALLVLGKASRRQLLSQNAKVLTLKQRILKKAIKQSAATSAYKNESSKRIANKLKKGVRRSNLQPKSEKSTGKDTSSESNTPSQTSKISYIRTIKSPLNTVQEGIQTNEKVLSAKEQNTSLKQNKILESPHSTTSNKYINEMTSPPSSVDKSTENYFLNSIRRCSKRLSSKNDTGRPDFIELSPTALGLIPKNIESFKTPKGTKRKSSSLVTPKNVQTSGIIRSASTSKIGNRKSVRFSSKDMSMSSSFCSPNMTQKNDLDFSHFHTPDITLDFFVSPLMDKSSMGNKEVTKNLNDSKITCEAEEIFNSSSSVNHNSSTKPKSHVQKVLEFPQLEKTLHKSPKQKEFLPSSKTSPVKPISPVAITAEKQSKAVNRKRSPKSDLSDLKGVKKLFKTPKAQKSPKNVLTDLRGVKKLLGTPKVQKSPKNDLSDLRGVKKLLRTPKLQKSPKNDLSDLRGVKKLLGSPTVQKSPKNDLSDLKGVKKLLGTPKVQKSPKNDLSDLRGVKKLLGTPKMQKGPKNDLSDLRGVKKLLGSPKVQKSPRNDLSDLRGVKKLLRTPKLQKSPKNDLSDLRGVKRLLGTPKVQKSPKNDLSDLVGIRKLLNTPRAQESLKNYLMEVSGVGKLFDSSVTEKHSIDLIEGATEEAKSPRLRETTNKSLSGLNKVLISSGGEGKLSEKKKTIFRKSHVNGFRAIKGRSTIHPTPKGPENDLSDVTGVRELFSRHKPTSDFSENLSGVAELFDLQKVDIVSGQKITKSRKKTVMLDVQENKVSKTETRRRKKELEDGNVEDEGIKVVLRSGRLRKATQKTESKSTKVKKSEIAEVLNEKKPTTRKAVEKTRANQAKKPSVLLKKPQRGAKKETGASRKKSQATAKVESSISKKGEVRSSRKRKATLDEPEVTPPKLRRKAQVPEKEVAGVTVETPKKIVIRSKNKTLSKKNIPVKSVNKNSVNASNKKTTTVSSKVQSKAGIDADAKQIRKVRSTRSQRSTRKNVTESEKKDGPKGSKGSRAETIVQNASKAQSEAVGKKIVKTSDRKDKLSPVVKRSTRRK